MVRQAALKDWLNKFNPSIQHDVWRNISFFLTSMKSQINRVMLGNNKMDAKVISYIKNILWRRSFLFSLLPKAKLKRSNTTEM